MVDSWSDNFLNVCDKWLASWSDRVSSICYKWLTGWPSIVIWFVWQKFSKLSNKGWASLLLNSGYLTCFTYAELVCLKHNASECELAIIVLLFLFIVLVLY